LVDSGEDGKDGKKGMMVVRDKEAFEAFKVYCYKQETKRLDIETGKAICDQWLWKVMES
jgi:hypothetical protein